MVKKSTVVSDIIDDIRRIFQVVNEQSKKAKRKTGLTGPQLWTIKTIAELSPVRVSDLARRMYLHPATVVGILNRLEVQGLVKRTRNDVDRRVVKIELTENAKALLVKAPRVAQGLLVVGLEELSLEKLEVIATSLQELVVILGAQEIPPQMMVSSDYNLPEQPVNTK